MAITNVRNFFPLYEIVRPNNDGDYPWNPNATNAFKESGPFRVLRGRRQRLEPRKVTLAFDGGYAQRIRRGPRRNLEILTGAGNRRENLGTCKCTQSCNWTETGCSFRSAVHRFPGSLISPQ